MSTSVDQMNGVRAKAFAVRAAWMEKMGFLAEEISEACVDDGAPIDLADEQEQLKYAEKLKEITPAAAVLASMAIKRKAD